jgi:hypothetical protein
VTVLRLDRQSPLALTSERAQRAAGEMDLDHDGEVSEDELAQATPDQKNELFGALAWGELMPRLRARDDRSVLQIVVDKFSGSEAKQQAQLRRIVDVSNEVGRTCGKSMYLHKYSVGWGG